MRFFTSFRLIVLFSISLLIFTVNTWADYASLEGLGNPNLVLEDETTRLNLFNMGNPAGLVFLPRQDRLDLTFQAGRTIDLEEFTTGDSASQTVQKSSSTTTVDGLSDTIGSYTLVTTKTKKYTTYPNVSPDGTTLTANAVYSWKRSLASGGLAASNQCLHQGVRLSPADALTLQFIPLASWQTTFSSDFDQRPFAWQTGGWLRGGYSLLPELALGAGILGTHARSSESGLDTSIDHIGAEAGLAYRAQELFDETDVLDLGITLKGGQGQAVEDDYQNITLDNQPVHAMFNGIYSYKSVMDVGLLVDYLYEDTMYRWNNNERLDSTLRTLDYELQFRVRLPMVRDDDLRFGVSFNNHGVEHPYPTGTLQTMDTSTGILNPAIKTASSGISIGAALVPLQGSIIDLQYNIGSSLTRQDLDDDYLADSGYTNFTLGAQFLIIKGLTLRASYVDQRVVYESNDYRWVVTSTSNSKTYTDGTNITTNSTVSDLESVGLLSQAVYSKTGNFGITLEDGPWKTSLNVTYGLTTYSPSGWSIEGKPTDVETVNKDKLEELSGMLSLSWMF